MKILLTGATGFIGRHLLQKLTDDNHELIITTRNNVHDWFTRTIQQHITVVTGDLFDAGFIERVIKEHKPDTIIHSAWWGSVGEKRSSNEQGDNLRLTERMIDSAIENSCNKFVGIGSQAEYGVYNCRIVETFVAKPDNAYGRCKLNAGKYLLEKAEQADMSAAWLRLFHAFGPADHTDYLIPTVTRSLLKNKIPELTNCEQIWDYLYVADVVSAIRIVVDKAEPFNGVYNLCSGEPKSLRVFVETIKDLINPAIELCYGAIPQRPDGLRHLEGDNTLFKDTFGWPKPTPLIDALQETIAWYREELKIV